MNMLVVIAVMLAELPLSWVAIKYSATLFSNLAGLAALFDFAELFNSGNIVFPYQACTSVACSNVVGSTQDYVAFLVFAIIMTVIPFVITLDIRLKRKNRENQ